MPVRGTAYMVSFEARGGTSPEPSFETLGNLPASTPSDRTPFGTLGGVLASIDASQESITRAQQLLGVTTKAPHLAPHVDYSFLQTRQAMHGLELGKHRYAYRRS